MSDDARMNLIEWIRAYDGGEFKGTDRDCQIRAGWYDWFCREESLRGRLDRMARKVKQMSKSPRIDPERTYVFFKNNCPLNGRLYDDFRFCDIESGDVLYTFVPANGHKNREFKSYLWGHDNGFEDVLAAGEWRDIVTYMMDVDARPRSAKYCIKMQVRKTLYHAAAARFVAGLVAQTDNESRDVISDMEFRAEAGSRNSAIEQAISHAMKNDFVVVNIRSVDCVS